VQYIFLVGGLSESPLLQQVTREKFSSRAQVLVPQEASLAVLKGAQFISFLSEIFIFLGDLISFSSVFSMQAFADVFPNLSSPLIS